MVRRNLPLWVSLPMQLPRWTRWSRPTWGGRFGGEGSLALAARLDWQGRGGWTGLGWA
jgi:hypothetical protein